ncbi:UNKNOWN [Stylonychia lemnae]|uniref:PH domain-containing protein n=1 Tax=Stylonychia lemnae TaxID=5949 RepID=A0A078B1P7_STYLE|nr:UNKNOWN [Stylonychia lemnae]|eukprot:CDW87247.1 UNKNOWN [Stylonychia lemnae]
MHVLASERVNQLKKEIEDLDNKLMSTNTINFQDLKSIRHQTISDNPLNSNHFEKSFNPYPKNNDSFTDDEEEDHYQNYPDHQGKYGTISNKSYEIEEQILRGQQRGKSSQNYSDKLKLDHNYTTSDFTDQIGSAQNKNNHYNFQTITPQSRQLVGQGNGQYGKLNMTNMSHLSHEGEVSFDLEKIYQKRNENIKSAFESNLKEKKEFIQSLEHKLNNIQKDCDAKTLKLAHLKYERDNIINQIQMEELKKKEMQKEVNEQQKRIDIKRKEDERAYNLAQNEIKRGIVQQEQTLQQLYEKSDLLSLKLGEVQQNIHEQNKLFGGQSGTSNELEERINQQRQKISSLQSKRLDVENNVQLLRDFLRQISEEIQMTQEDLNGKLMQRAEFVAQREELDQMYESGKKAFGKSFEIYLKIKDINSSTGNLHSARYLDEEYESSKAQSFFVDILQQLRSSCKSKFYEKINQIQQKIEQEPHLLDLEKCIQMIINLSKSLGILIERDMLLQKLHQQSLEKDRLFEKRQVQLIDIVNEIKRFEKLIKENSNLVDNMILPQLKAMSTTYNEHKQKYKKLKQASFVLKERIKKAEKEHQTLTEERSKFQSQFHLGSQVRHIEQEILILNERINQEQQEMDRLNENASQIEKEYRRAQQSLLLKERELLRKYATDSQKSLNGTQSQLLQSQIIKQEQEEDRLRKKFIEIEEKIKITLKDKDEVYKNTIPNNRRHYQNQSRREVKDDFQDEYQVTSVTDSEMDNNSQMGRSLNNQMRQQTQNLRSQDTLQSNNNQQRTFHSKSNSIALDGSKQQQKSSMKIEKENSQAQIRRKSIGKIDLTKALAYRDNMFSINEPEIIKNQKSDKDSAVSYYNNSDHNQLLSNSTNVLDNDTNNRNQFYMDSNYQNMNFNSLNRYCSKNATQGSEMRNLGDDIINILQQSNFLNESQTNHSNMSILNLSDLLMNNNALQNLLNLANTQESKQMSQSINIQQQNDNDPQNRPFSQLTFNHSQNEKQAKNMMSSESLNLNSQKYQVNYLQESNLSDQNTLQNSQYSYKYQPDIKITSNHLRESTNRLLQSSNQNSQLLFENTGVQNINNQSNVADQSLIQCLNEINNGMSNKSNTIQSLQDFKQQKKNQSMMKRTSIDTADFQQYEPKQSHTIDYESRGYMHQDQSQPHLSPQIKCDRVQQYEISQNDNQQFQSLNTIEMRMSQQNPLKQSIIGQKNQIKSSWMSKYLSNVNDSSRLDCIQESVSPKPNQKKAQKLRYKSGGNNQVRNRSTSQEQRFNNNSKLNMSINSVNSSMNFNTLHNQSCYEGINRSNSRGFTKKSRKLNKSLNNVDSSIILQQSINSSLMNPINMSLNFQNLSNFKSGYNGNHQNSCFVNFQSNNESDPLHFTKVEVLFGERMVPLLDGAAFYKKFSSRQSLNENAFDPLNADKFPPESCGYGIRLFQLDKSLMSINIRQSLKNAVENTISLNEIVKPILPQTTMDIIKAQKQFSLQQQANQLRKSSRNGFLGHQGQGNQQSQVNSAKDLLEEFLILDTKGSISHLAKIGIVNKNSELYRQKCLDSTYYPFSIALTKGRVELIATSYETLKNWIIGLNLLVSNKKHIPKIRQIMDIRLD